MAERGSATRPGLLQRGGGSRLATLTEATMPFLDVKAWLGVEFDQLFTVRSKDNMARRAGRCHLYEQEVIDCSHGLGTVRASRECQHEIEDYKECLFKAKMIERMKVILQQRDKLIQEGKYTPRKFSEVVGSP
ncbi:unnamed protein product [Lampetra fluviatilis]